MSEIKLKPCPFCGGEAEMFGNESVVFVRCKECTCITEWYDDGEHKGVMVKEERGEHVLKTLFDELDEGSWHVRAESLRGHWSHPRPDHGAEGAG